MSPALPHARLLRILTLSTLLASALLQAFGASGTAEPGRLFFGNEDLPGLQSRLVSDFGRALLKRQASVLDAPAAPAYIRAHGAAGYAFRQVFAKDKASGKTARLLLEETLETLQQGAPMGAKGLLEGKEAEASALVGLAISFDLLYDSLTEDQRVQLARGLLTQARRLSLAPAPENRPQYYGREQILCAAASGLGALAAAVDPSLRQESLELASKSRQVLVRHIGELGDQGWPRDSVDALRLCLSHGVGAFFRAWKRSTGEDLFTQSPARHWATLYCMLMIPPPKTGAEPRIEAPLFGPLPPLVGKAPGPGWPENQRTGGDLSVLLSLADAASRTALLWCFEACHGMLGDGDLDIHKGSDALFLLLGSATPEPAINPARTLGRVWKDDVAGVLLLRNQWKDANDCIAAFTTNTRPVAALPSYADAGSFRLTGLGGRWAIRRQMDETDLSDTSRECENVVVIPGTHGWLGGRLLETRGLPDGSGSMLVNLDACYSVAPAGRQGQKLVSTFDIGIRAKRSWTVDYSGNCGAPVLVGIADQIQNGPPRRWLMHTGEKDIRLTSNGFEITASNGATLRALVLSPSRPRLSVKRHIWSSSLCIDGEGDFFVVMTLQPAGQPQPALRSEGEGLSSKAFIGKSTIRHDGSAIAIR